jgi:tetratricopeptide (TPR) repeat protein
VAQGQAEAGLVDDALATAALISDPAFRTDAMGFAAVALARHGRTREALALLRRLPERNRSGGILTGMAVAEAKAGRKDDAFDTLRRIDHPPQRMDALVGIATDEADAGRFEEALATSDLIEEWARHPALVAIAVGMASAGRIDDAEALAATIGPPMMYPKAWVPYTPPDERPKATAAIAAARAREGDWERAVETARAVPDAAGRATALAALAVERPGSDALSQALAAAWSVEEYWARADVLSRMAIGLAQAGLWADAVMVARDLGPSGLSDIVLAVHAP